MGGCHCIFRDCNVSTSRNPSMHFFRYPVKDKIRIEKWAQMTAYKDVRYLEEYQLKNRVVCARHFRDECFMNYKRDRLTKDAVPTLYRLPKNMALDFEFEAQNGKPSLITLEPPKMPHLIPPEDFILPFELEDDTIAYAMYDTDNSSNSAQQIEEQHELQIEQLNDQTQLDEGELLHGAVTLLDLFESEPTKPQKQIKRKYKILNNLKSPKIQKLSNTTEVNRSKKTQIEIQLIKKVDLNKTLNFDNECLEEMFTEIDNNAESNLENASQSEFDNNVQLELDERNEEVNALHLQINDLNAQLQQKEQISIESIYTNDKLSTLNNALEEKNTKLTTLNVNLEKQRKDAQEKYITLKDKHTNLQKEYELLQKKYDELKQEKEVATVSTSKDNVATSNFTAITSSKLTKAQLFNSIKKYLSSSMLALLRMEMFGNAEREWKPDEQRTAVDLLRLGENIYTYFRDEWRFRLPPLRQVHTWLNESAISDNEEDL